MKILIAIGGLLLAANIARAIIQGVSPDTLAHIIGLAAGLLALRVMDKAL